MHRYRTPRSQAHKVVVGTGFLVGLLRASVWRIVQQRVRELSRMGLNEGITPAREQQRGAPVSHDAIPLLLSTYLRRVTHNRL